MAGGRTGAWLRGWVAGLACVLFAAGAAADEIAGEPPVLITADELNYDKGADRVTARGGVEMTYDGRILRADEVSYDQRSDTVTAVGNVVILEPTGEVLFADRAVLSDQLKNGFIAGIRGLFADDTRIAAFDARRIDGNRTVMRRVVYSPCNLCSDHPERPPLWQLKAVEVVHNQKSKRIDYKDVILEVFGVPVAYAPYFSHPDPSVKRKSGLLAPVLGSSSDLGLTLQTPYYYAAAPYRDFTFAPIFTSKEGVVLAGEYRERTRNGRLQFDGSITRPRRRNENNERVSGRDTRGHVRGSGQFDIDETWRWGFDLFRATDDTYLKRYNISSADTLTSSLRAEGFRGRNYAAATAWLFQGLAVDDDPGETTVVLPLVEFSHVGEPGRGGQRLGLDASFLVLGRTEGTDSRRLSAEVSWRRPYVGRMGDVYSLNASLRGDVYLVNEVVDPVRPTGPKKSGFVGRLLPKVWLDWRYPLVRREGGVRQVIEPVVSAILAPYGGNPGKIPNEDSQSFEFDDSNLFSSDRFPGLDRVEDGPRINYGLKAGVYGAGGGSSTILFGQVLRAESGKTFAEKTGLEDNFSDFVGRIDISPGRFIDYVHRFRLSRRNLAIRRNEIDLTLGPDRLKLTAGYVKLARELTSDEFESREELRLSVRARLDERWTFTAFDQRDLTDEGGTLRAGAGLEYRDECITINFTFDRRFTRDRDIEPASTFNFRITLRGLG